jgi:chemotaxis protein MotB
MAGKGGGGAWKVAYADFVTAMMAFFLVMWITAQSQKVKTAIARHFNAPYFSEKIPKNPDKSGKPLPKGKKPVPTAPVDPEGDVPRVLSLRDAEHTATACMVFFGEDSIELSDVGKERLGKLVEAIVGLPHKIEVRGHTSCKPLPPGSPYKSHLELAYARALVTANYLESQGIAANRIRLSQAGIHEPFTLKVQPEEQAKNPRVEVFLLNELARDLDGKPPEREQRFETSTSPAH